MTMDTYQTSSSSSFLDGTTMADSVAMCPCPSSSHGSDYLSFNSSVYRHLAEADDEPNPETWETVYTIVVLVLMFIILAFDKFGADSIMMCVLAAFLVAEIITVKEGLAGFSNQGLITVMLLFVVAEGVAKTGALDWYLFKMLGKPKSIPAAQLRLMVPIAITSTFINNTPIDVIMIPIVQRWSRNCKLPIQQLLIPLSFSTILGGTCSLIGTSTNLVVVGLLEDKYGSDNPETKLNLFDVGVYGVPNALCGMAYILFFARYLLPFGREKNKGKGNKSSGSLLANADKVLLGAKVTQWSPAAGRTIKRSGLRDTGGIYLVSVKRAATGNIHRAVSSDFVVNIGDILYFTGLIDEFGEFCEEHGLEVVTTDSANNDTMSEVSTVMDGVNSSSPTAVGYNNPDALPILDEDDEFNEGPVPVGVTIDSLVQASEDERMRIVNHITDMIRGDDNTKPKRGNAPSQVVVSIDRDFVLIGIDTRDRSALLLDIAKELNVLKLQLHHTEAAVTGERSLSTWRCGPESKQDIPNIEKIWKNLSSSLSKDSSITPVVKGHGLRVIRAKVTVGSSLIGKTASDVHFRNMYKAAIVAIQNDQTSNHTFQEGDVLILQANSDSALLERPPENFYTNLAEASRGGIPRTNSKSKFNFSFLKGADEQTFDAAAAQEESGDEESAIAIMKKQNEKVWRDLQVIFKEDRGGGAVREFLTAMQVARKSKLAGKTVAQLDIIDLPDLVLVSIERPVEGGSEAGITSPTKRIKVTSGEALASVTDEGLDHSEHHATLHAIELSEPLKVGDILWYSGPATAVGDLRKIPGLVLYQDDEVNKVDGKVHDRRLVQAVISRHGPLVGTTVKETRFRTRYGAAVIAVHRNGNRVHEHPGSVKLQPGDVLLLEAGPSFIAKSSDRDRAFALLSEVKDSAPPRLTLLVPALVLFAGMLAVYMLKLTPLVVSSLVAAILMVCFGLLTEQEVRDAINWEIFIIIAAAFGIGTAMTNSGVAEGIANGLVSFASSLGWGDAGLLGGVYMATFLISNVLTNNAAAALLFPVAMSTAEQTGCSKTLLSFALMLGASASFMTPYGYTTNLMIYGPGGYKYMDYVYFGAPLQIFLFVMVVLFLGVLDPVYSWIGSFVFFVIVAVWTTGSVYVAEFFGKLSGTKGEDNPEEAEGADK